MKNKLSSELTQLVSTVLGLPTTAFTATQKFEFVSAVFAYLHCGVSLPETKDNAMKAFSLVAKSIIDSKRPKRKVSKPQPVATVKQILCPPPIEPPKHPFNVSFGNQTLRQLSEDAGRQGVRTGELALHIAYTQLQNMGEPPRVKTTRKFRKAKRVKIKIPNDDRLAFIMSKTKGAHPKQQISPTIRRLVELHYERKSTTPDLF